VLTNSPYDLDIQLSL